MGRGDYTDGQDGQDGVMAWIKGMDGDLVSLGDWIPACAGMTV